MLLCAKLRGMKAKYNRYTAAFGNRPRVVVEVGYYEGLLSNFRICRRRLGDILLFRLEHFAGSGKELALFR